MTAENEQHESKQSFDFLELCCRLVGEKYGNPSISTWTNSDYIKLSGILSRQTDVQISPSTLKRIFGKLKTSERYYPQKATRDALADFAGFSDWETFVLKHPRPTTATQSASGQVIETEPPIQKTEIAIKRKVAHKKRNWFGLLIPGTIIIAIITWQLFKKQKPADFNKNAVTFLCLNPEGGNPHSATFKIALAKNFSGDTAGFSIDFDDGRMDKKVSSGSVFTHYYEIPGRYYPVLKYMGLPIDTLAVYLKSEGWTATAIMERDTTRVYPITSNSLVKNGELRVTTYELLHAGVDTNRTFFVHFVNSKPVNISGDNFELTVEVTTSKPRPGVRCSQVNIELYGEKSSHSVVLIKPGCVSWAHLHFSEVLKDGETEDLSTLGADLSKKGAIRLRIENRLVSLFVNEKLVYETKYQLPLKQIYGAKVVFSGVGTLHKLRLQDLKTGKVFGKGFNID